MEPTGSEFERRDLEPDESESQIGVLGRIRAVIANVLHERNGRETRRPLEGDVLIGPMGGDVRLVPQKTPEGEQLFDWLVDNAYEKAGYSAPHRK